MRYQDFVIRIDVRENACRVQVSSPAGEGQGDFVLPFSVDELGSVLAGVERGVARDAVLVRDAPPATPSMTPQEFGGKLFSALFSGQVALLFDRSWGQVTQEPGQGLRLRLQFDLTEGDATRLTGLPWEYLYREATGDFLALDRRTPILRYLEVPVEAKKKPSLPPRLRILVIAASPAGLAPINMVKEIDKLETAWGSEDVEIVRPERPDIDAAVEALSRDEVHVVHFIGHGGFDSSGEGMLYFENEKGGHQVVSSSTLADVLRGFDSVRLVFLNCCHSARSVDSSGADPFTGVATALVRGGIPVVLGMQFPISDPAAIRFSRVVYQSLAKGDSIDAAATHGRLAIRAGDAKSLEWGTPVLFSRVGDGRIFDSGGTAGPDDPIFWSWLWSGLGVLTSYLTLAIWAATAQLGSDANIHVFGFEIATGPYSAAIFGVFPVGLLTLVQLRIAQQYDRTFRPRSFWNRMPLPFGLSKRRLGRFKNRIQGFFFALFLLIPVAGQAHFLSKMIRGSSFLKKGELFAQGWDHFTKFVPFSVFLTDDYRFDTNEGVTFFPFWQPWAFVVLVAFILTYSVIVIKQLARRNKPLSSPGKDADETKKF